MKKKQLIVIIFIAFSLLFCGSAYAEELTLPEERGALLYEENSNRVLYAQNESKKIYPASTTKLMTALITIENMDLEDQVTVGEEITRITHDSSKAELMQGEVLTVRELLYGLLLPSGNDAAFTLARAVGSTVGGVSGENEAIDYFVSMMNDRAKALGAVHTHFKNPHGLHDDDHYTSLEDMLVITREVLKNDDIRKIVDTPNYDLANVWATHKWYNTNFLLHRTLDEVSKGVYVGENPYYTPDVNGVKTGNTSQAGRCLVFSASRGDLQLIGLLFQSTDDDVWREAVSLLDYAEDEYEFETLPKEGKTVGTLTLANGIGKDSVSVRVKDQMRFLLNHEESARIEDEISYDEDLLKEKSDGSYTLKESVKADQVIGRITYGLGDVVLGETAIYPEEDVQARTLLHYLFYTGMVIVVVIIILRMGHLKKKD